MKDLFRMIWNKRKAANHHICLRFHKVLGFTWTCPLPLLLSLYYIASVITFRFLICFLAGGRRSLLISPWNNPEAARAEISLVMWGGSLSLTSLNPALDIKPDWSDRKQKAGKREDLFNSMLLVLSQILVSAGLDLSSLDKTAHSLFLHSYIPSLPTYLLLHCDLPAF